ncbi:DUF418 domain-containing protein [Paenibacillus sp. L3-i20]|uniref:DUF418 domain-containing protein n=1 Tax=Paenibacillus sp. L3-i20 TaxID=2905833 RepID=UPI001EE0C8A6|nr:DUF418 domain-containing protein [Paenibacillus sp. L3-i20]GKU75618.1 membrane protein [Paenibacillus sp. L3-i20]
MIKSIKQHDRIVSLDIIRGLALFGILFINIAGYKVLVEGGPMPDTTGINSLINASIDVLIQKKFFSIFSFLFGVGFYIFASRAELRGDKPRLLFARRLLTLFLIGVVQVFFFPGTILPIYAIIGLFLIPFFKATNRTIVIWLLSITAFYVFSLIILLSGFTSGLIYDVASLIGTDATLIFIMFLAGFLSAKANWLRQIQRLKSYLKWIGIITLPLFVFSSYWIWKASIQNSELIDQIIGIGTIPTVLLYLVTLFTILENGYIRRLLMPIARVGQMALTNYFAQSFIGLALMALIGIDVVSATDIVVIAPIIFAIHIVTSYIWFNFFKMGPLEMVWRFMTYGKNPKRT